MTTSQHPPDEGRDSQGLVIENLRVRYSGRDGDVDAVRGVSLEVPMGVRMGIVGESGSGKSTLLKSVLKLIRPPGTVRFDRLHLGSRDLATLSGRDFRSLCGAEISMVFQDPVSALNPVFTIRDQFTRIFRLQGLRLSRQERERRMLAALSSVGISGRGKLDRYPFEWSQGQLQRIVIALACSSERLKVLLADEPTASLDVTTEAQVIDLLRDLQAEIGFALVLVTHNLPVVAELCDHVVVMRDGEIVEEQDVVGLFANPEHAYTRQLLGAMPSLRHTERGVA